MQYDAISRTSMALNGPEQTAGSGSSNATVSSFRFVN